jgi:universal stress protein E
MPNAHAFDHPPKLLVATDLSARADNAVDRAAQLATATGGEVAVLHVLNDLPASLGAEFKERTAQVLRRQIESAQALAPFKAEITVANGGSDAVINAEAQSKSVDLIVCGNHRMRYGADRWLGSTMDRVLKYGDRPLLIVKAPGAKPYTKLIVGVDFSEHSKRTLEYALRLVPGAEVTVLHAYQVPFASMPKPKSIAGAVAKGAQSEYAEHLDAWLKQFAQLIQRTKCRVVPRIERGQAEALIPDLVKASGADLVAIGTHGRTGFRHAILGSVAESLITSVPCDVLVVR